MKPPAQEILKLDEAANILRCEIEDILENWSLGKIFLCINIIPPQEVIVIDYAYVNYLDDHGIDLHGSNLDIFYGAEEYGVRIKEISGPFYLMPEVQKRQSRPFVTEPSKFVITGQNMLSTEILIPAQKFDDLVRENIEEQIKYVLESFRLNKDHFRGFTYKTKHLRITNSELNRFSEINSLNINNIVDEKPLQENERNNLMLTIGALAEMYAHEKGAAFKSGEKPNISRVTEKLLKYLNSDIYGLGKSALNKRISDGIKLLQKAKKDS